MFSHFIYKMVGDGKDACFWEDKRLGAGPSALCFLVYSSCLLEIIQLHLSSPNQPMPSPILGFQRLSTNSKTTDVFAFLSLLDRWMFTFGLCSSKGFPCSFFFRCLSNPFPASTPMLFFYVECKNVQEGQVVCVVGLV